MLQHVSLAETRDMQRRQGRLSLTLSQPSQPSHVTGFLFGQILGSLKMNGRYVDKKNEAAQSKNVEELCCCGEMICPHSHDPLS